MDPRFSLQIMDGKMSVEQRDPQPVLIPNPVDMCALEAAMVLKNIYSNEVVVITVGVEITSEVLIMSLARGADRAIHIRTPQRCVLDAWAVAMILSGVIKEEKYDLVICGQRSVDHSSGQVGPAIAELLNLPQVTRVAKLDVQPDKRRFIAQRILERGNRQNMECTLPALISVTEFMNIPRYVSVQRRERIREEQIEIRDLAIPDIDKLPLTRILEVKWPKPRARMITMPDPTMNAAERLMFLMTGGREKEKRKIYKGPADYVADRLIEVLQERGVL